MKFKHQGDKSVIHFLGLQRHLGLFDFHAEQLDLNRHVGESIPAYIRRVWDSNIMSETNCLGLQEMTPAVFQLYNERIKTHDHTYYFSHSTGERKKQREK